TVPAANVYQTECDIYAPCALGATLNEQTIPLLGCRGVAGSANNQLAEDDDADRLHDRGILYAPDFIANGGGALAFALIKSGITDEAKIA
ncbi:MAG: amino acid dehydrogenase, partial [Acidobacteria bacterium]|nr:amino acid dehydrogenase [Acidobacteriota bacterium]NIO58448.1 amino acid dehydrogenase [Acidobacteriota bacterium]NIQ29511.1 amino acid dehydrogenase [Acidobacteriota bacterium]NIQ84193.1 amino acid dehydrogenase [Acidobacteriota bacterium]